jgi:hypothetical protein
MNRIVFAIGILVAWNASHAIECAVSLPESSGLPDSLQNSPEGFVWVGTPKLAARVPADGHWTAMGPDYNYRDKWPWWREGYRANAEQKPALTISARRLDGDAPAVYLPDATNAFGPGWDRILTLMEFPSPGCWEVVGRYHGEELRFVFKVGE